MDHQSPRSMQMKAFFTTVALGACLLFHSGELAFAAKPGPTCEDKQTSPGHPLSPQGSPFNESLPGKAGTVYANGTENPPGNQTLENHHANLEKAVSQYDVACTKQKQVP